MSSLSGFASDDTIVAVSTPAGGAIAVTRLSGRQAIEIADRMFTAASGVRLADTAANKAVLGVIKEGSEAIDEVVSTIYRSPSSYTGGDIVEFATHGSPYVVRRVMELAILNGARAAGPGEFTMRAFMSGKLDLSQAEAVADLISSEDKGSHQLAIRQLKGQLSQRLSDLRSRLIDAACLLELELDFSEEDVEFADRGDLTGILNDILSEVQQLVASFRAGNAIKNGIPVAIVGPPNAGKSTLLNTLMGEQRALVTDIPGTTRDSIEDVMSIGGLKFRFIDTAGIRQANDTVEKMGIDRTLEKAGGSAVVLVITDKADPCGIAEEYCEMVDSLGELPDARVWLVVNKIDRDAAFFPSKDDRQICDEIAATGHRIPEEVHFISAKQNINIDHLTTSLAGKYIGSFNSASGPVLTEARHLENLMIAGKYLRNGIEALQGGKPADLVAEDIRSVLEAIGAVTGEAVSDTDILQNIFSKFCIGK